MLAIDDPSINNAYGSPHGSLHALIDYLFVVNAGIDIWMQLML